MHVRGFYIPKTLTAQFTDVIISSVKLYPGMLS